MATDTRNLTATGHVGQLDAADRLKRAKKAALAAFLGGMLEYYDFFIYATAASLIFSHIFFPAGDPTIALMASFATFGVAYVARPFGAVVFGHLGDRLGRKNTLVLTLLLMGGATFLIGLLPTFEQVGYLAPGALVLLRLLQGLSAGAETAGSSTLTMEESPVGRRGFFPSFAMSGISAGIVLASLVFIPVAAMDEAARFTWGWRIPFLLSVVVMIVAMLVRRSLEEPEVFEDEVKDRAGAKEKAPFLVMLKTHPAQFVQISLMSFQCVTNTLMQAFGLAYAVSVGIPAATMLGVSIAGNVLAMFTQPLSAYLSDRFGRRPIFIAGIMASGALIWVYFWSISTAHLALIFSTSIAITAGSYAVSNAIYPAWFSELFNVKVRYSGVAIGLQVGILCAGFTPMIATVLVDGIPANYGPAAWIVAGSSIVAAIGAIWARETFKTPLHELGNPVE